MKTPRVSIYLSPTESSLIRCGLGWILSTYALHEKTGKFHPAHPRSINHGFDRGQFHAPFLETMQQVLKVCGRNIQSGRTVRLSAVGLAACMLAVRICTRQVRHAHQTPWLEDHRGATKLLLAKLERYRKRAKRAFVQLYSQADFTEESGRWKRFVRWVRVRLLDCPCDQSHFTTLRRKAGLTPKQMQNSWIEGFRTDLPEVGLRVPPEEELRNLVRRAIRSARRLQRSLGRLAMRHDRDIFRKRIWKFVTERCERA